MYLICLFYYSGPVKQREAFNGFHLDIQQSVIYLNRYLQLTFTAEDSVHQVIFTKVPVIVILPYTILYTEFGLHFFVTVPHRMLFPGAPVFVVCVVFSTHTLIVGNF